MWVIIFIILSSGPILGDIKVGQAQSKQNQTKERFYSIHLTFNFKQMFKPQPKETFQIIITNLSLPLSSSLKSPNPTQKWQRLFQQGRRFCFFFGLSYVRPGSSATTTSGNTPSAEPLTGSVRIGLYPTRIRLPRLSHTEKPSQKLRRDRLWFTLSMLQKSRASWTSNPVTQYRLCFLLFYFYFLKFLLRQKVFCFPNYCCCCYRARVLNFWILGFY